MDVIESTWKVRLFMSSGAVLEGVYIGHMNDSDDDVSMALLGSGRSLSRFDPTSLYNTIYKDLDGMDVIYFRVGDVSAMEISPT